MPDEPMIIEYATPATVDKVAGQIRHELHQMTADSKIIVQVEQPDGKFTNATVTHVLRVKRGLILRVREEEH